MSIRQAAMIGVLWCGVSSLAVADEPVKLPEPLQEVTLDLGLLNDHFTVADSQFYQSGEFHTFGNKGGCHAD